MTGQKELKIAAATAAAGEIRSGFTVGLGTGSTAEEFVKVLAGRMERGELRDIRGVATSLATEALALSLGVPMVTLQEVEHLDIAVDGTDEIDQKLRLIKGRGGALLREKIVEQEARRFLVIADESKLVPRLGQGVLPVEVVRFASDAVLRRLERLHCQPRRRTAADQSAAFVTDEGHHIIDVAVRPSIDIAELVAEIRKYAGVVETGFFPTEASEAIIASPSGIRRLIRP